MRQLFDIPVLPLGCYISINQVCFETLTAEICACWNCVLVLLDYFLRVICMCVGFTVYFSFPSISVSPSWCIVRVIFSLLHFSTFAACALGYIYWGKRAWGISFFFLVSFPCDVFSEMIFLFCSTF